MSLRTRNYLPFAALAVSLLGVQVSGVWAATRDPADMGELNVNITSFGGPLEGAIVLLARGSAVPRLGISGVDGKCRFRDLSPGRYSVQIVMPAYFVSQEDDTDPTEVEVYAGQKQTLNITLARGGVIIGRALNAQGLPIIALPLTAVRVNQGSQTELPPSSESNVTALSDDKGQFRIYGLKPGRYAIVVNVNRGMSALPSAATFYYKDQRELVNANLLDIVAGQETAALEMEIDLERGNTSSLSGRVLGLHSLPLEGVFVSLQQSDGGYVTASSYSDREGYFRFDGLPPGKYAVKGQSRQNYYNAQQQITLKEFSAGELVLQLRPFLKIAGNVYLRRGTETTPVSTKIHLRPFNSGENISFASDTQGRFSVVTGRDGLFAWDLPGIPTDQYLETVSLGTQVITYKALRLNQKQSLERVFIQIASGAATLSGQLGDQDGDDCLRFAVYAVATELGAKSIRGVKRADICSGSSFNIYSLPPASYYVFALPIIKSEGLPAEPSRTRFHDVADDRLELIEKALVDLRKRGRQPLAADRGKTYRGIVPIFLSKPSSLGAAP